MMLPVNSVDNVVAQKQDQTSPPASQLMFPMKDAELLQFGTRFRFVNYSYENQATNAQFITHMSGASIFLPLPKELSNSLSLNYADVSAGLLGFAVKAGASIGNAVRASELSGNTNVTAMLASLKGAAPAAESAALSMLMKTAGEVLPGATEQISQLTGLVANPFNVATFKNPNNRSFSLTFTMIPQTPEDSAAIQNIIAAFQYHSLPRKITSGAASGSIQNQSIFWEMPDEVEIEFYGTSKLFAFARSVITGVSVNYAAGGQAAFFNDGSPAAVVMSVHVKELQQLDQASFGAQVGSQIAQQTPAFDADNTLSESPTLGGS